MIPVIQCPFPLSREMQKRLADDIADWWTTRPLRPLVLSEGMTLTLLDTGAARRTKTPRTIIPLATIKARRLAAQRKARAHLFAPILPL